MTLRAPEIAKSAKPCQFIMVRCVNSCQPFLRRPFSIHSVKGSNIEILYEVIGEGTKVLLQKKTCEYLDIIGPLGNGFDLRKEKPILVAGGIGVAPLLFLAERLKVKGQGCKVLIGARTKKEILCEKEFKALGYNVRIATDDGSKGYKGFVTDLLYGVIAKCRGNPCGCPFRAGASPAPTIYACGPQPMLKEVAAIAKRFNISAQVSLETHMACGIGACLGCVVETKDGYKLVCKEGPVFNAREIIW
jgi:dihydroorotate dehydrogenase electron transfer subunit